MTVDVGAMWMVFPIIFLVFMLFMMTRMMGLWGGGRRGGPRMGRVGTGPMGMMGDDDYDNGNRDREPGGNALDILRRRYASGEITDEQFDAMRSRLEGGPR